MCRSVFEAVAAVEQHEVLPEEMLPHVRGVNLSALVVAVLGVALLCRGHRDGDTKIACVLHAHLLLLFKNLGKDDVNKTVASVVLSAQARVNPCRGGRRFASGVSSGAIRRFWSVRQGSCVSQ